MLVNIPYMEHMGILYIMFTLKTYFTYVVYAIYIFHIFTGWWFGTSILFSDILGISSSQHIFHYFSEGLKPPSSFQGLHIQEAAGVGPFHCIFIYFCNNQIDTKNYMALCMYIYI